MSRRENTRFISAKDIYIDRLKPTGWQKENTWDPNSKYARAARLGLCFKCLRDDTNPKHRPKHAAFPYCDECYAKFHMGVERIEAMARLQVGEWFDDK